MEGDGGEEAEFNLSEWAVKAQIAGGKGTRSRRFSAPNMRSFREDGRSFRSSITISSAASSPGFPSREEIDPSTYSFTSALKALRGRAGQGYWECMSPEGFALNSKWDEAEKYIINPESGEVPMECLSSKTLRSRSFRGFAGRIAMSAPLSYSQRSRRLYPTAAAATTTNPVLPDIIPHGLGVHSPIPEKKVTRDVGAQSTPPEPISSSPSPASTPPIEERSIKRGKPELEDSPVFDSDDIINSKLELEEEKIEEKEITEIGEQEIQRKKPKQVYRCLPWRGLWMRKRGERMRKANQGGGGGRRRRKISLLAILMGAA